MFPVQRTVSMLWILLHLFYLSVEDIREQKISMLVVLELGITGILYAWTSGHVPSPVPGCLVLLTAFLSKERIGCGDGWLMLAMGMWTGTAELLQMFFGGVMLGTLYAFCFQKKELPLVPFLTAAYIMGEWL